MYAAVSLRRTPIILRHFRLCSTTTSPQPRRRYPPLRQHEFANPAPFLGSWETPTTPREAEAKLDRLRKDYAKKMKQVRKEYAYEIEMLRLEKERKDEAAKEARRVENERRKVEKAKAAESKAVERKAFEQEFRQMLMKERAQKLESWRAKEELRENRKKEQRELIRKQSSLWIAEENLEQKMLDATQDTHPL